MKVKVYVKNRPEKVASIKVESNDDLKNIVRLAQTEIIRNEMLKDIDYGDVKLIFSIDGDKYKPQEIVNMGMEELRRSSKDKDEKKSKDKKKKKKSDSKKSLKKKKDSDSKKKKSKNGKKKIKKKDSKKKKSKKMIVEDGYVHMTRIG